MQAEDGSLKNGALGLCDASSSRVFDVQRICSKAAWHGCPSSHLILLRLHPVLKPLDTSFLLIVTHSTAITGPSRQCKVNISRSPLSHDFIPASLNVFLEHSRRVSLLVRWHMVVAVWNP